MQLTRKAAIAAALRTVIFGGAGLAVAATTQAAPNSASVPSPRFPTGSRILFQGDSITDGGRERGEDPNHIFGQDYAYLIAAQCGGHHPEGGWTFFNRGVSGNKVTDLASRWPADTLDLKPDLLSILIGVNDAGSVVSGAPNAVTAAQYETVYDQLLQQTQTALPTVRLVLCEPFVLPVGNVKGQWDRWNAEVQKRRDAVARLAAKYHAPLVRFQSMFDAACRRAPADYWIWDGVHPRAAGHQLMADEWLRTVNPFYGKNK